MNTNLRNTPRWSTSSFGGPTVPSALELSELKEQLDECNGSRAWLFDLRGSLKTAYRFVAARLITALACLLLCAVAAAALWSALRH